MSKQVPRRRRVSDPSPSLPEDMVAEILSWLPVKSLLRFKCVCKKWREIIERDEEFVDVHCRRAATCFYYHKKYISQPTLLSHRTRPPPFSWPLHKNAQFSCIDTQKGLILEHERHEDPTERLRLRNPATNQTVYLPDLRVGNEPPTWVVAKMFFVAKNCNECTVISFSESEESVLFGRFRAITVGVNTIDAAWRPLKNSSPDSIHCIGNGRRLPDPEIYALSIENVFHVVTMNTDDKQILSVNVENESIKTAKIPENLFPDWSNVMPREWNTKLSLFCFDNGDKINICVLQNYDKNEWAKTGIVDVAAFTQDYPIPFFTEELKVWIRGVDGKRWAVIWSPVEIVYVPWCIKNAIVIKPTILHLKGMQSEKVEEEAIDTHFWMEKDMPMTTSQIISVISLSLKYVRLIE